MRLIKRFQVSFVLFFYLDFHSNSNPYQVDISTLGLLYPLSDPIPHRLKKSQEPSRVLVSVLIKKPTYISSNFRLFMSTIKKKTDKLDMQISSVFNPKTSTDTFYSYVCWIYLLFSRWFYLNLQYQNHLIMDFVELFFWVLLHPRR